MLSEPEQIRRVLCRKPVLPHNFFTIQETAQRFQHLLAYRTHFYMYLSLVQISFSGKYSCMSPGIAALNGILY